MGGGEGLESGRWLAASRADARDGERGSDAHTGKDFRVRVLVMSPRAKAEFFAQIARQSPETDVVFGGDDLLCSSSRQHCFSVYFPALLSHSSLAPFVWRVGAASFSIFDVP